MRYPSGWTRLQCKAWTVVGASALLTSAQPAPTCPQSPRKGTSFPPPENLGTDGAVILLATSHILPGAKIRWNIHTGECEVVDGKRAGLAVTIGSRIAAIAGPREVLVSRTVKDLTAGSGFSFDDKGEHELKGVPEHWQLYRVGA